MTLCSWHYSSCKSVFPEALFAFLILLSKHFVSECLRHSISAEYMYSMQKSPDYHSFIDRHPQYSNVVIGAGFSG